MARIMAKGCVYERKAAALAITLLAVTLLVLGVATYNPHLAFCGFILLGYCLFSLDYQKEAK